VSRLFAVEELLPLAKPLIKQLAATLLADTRAGDSAQALMDLGATVCLARIPRCGTCPLASACPSRGRRYEPLRKQSRFEGSFRQRRAQTLQLVAESERPLADLDREAVESLAQDGLVEVASCGTHVTLP